MNIIQDTINVNKEALKRTFKSIAFVPALALVLIVFKVSESFVLTFLSANNSASSFILGFARAAISIAFMSALISVLADMVLYNRMNLNNIGSRFTEYFTPLANTYFYIFLAEYVIYFVDPTFSIILLLLFHVFVSNLYEQVYIGNNSGTYAIVKDFDFLKNNFIQWLPVVIAYVFLEFNFAISYTIFMFDLSYFIRVFIVAFALAFVYLYKGHLFNILYSSSMRKREFQGKF